MENFDFHSLFVEKLEFFKSLLPFSSVKWEAYNPKKSQPLLRFFDAQASNLYIRYQKSMNFSKKRVISFLLNEYSQHNLLDSRQGRYFFLEGIVSNLQLSYYYLPSSNEELIPNLDMFQIKGFQEENSKESYLVAFSLDQEKLRESLQKIHGTPTNSVFAIQIPLDAIYIKETGENVCEITHIVSKKFGGTRLSLTNFDWEQGQFLERLSTVLGFTTGTAIDSPQSEDIALFLKEIQEKQNKNSAWIEKYKESLKPIAQDFENIEKVDLFNLFGEPYQSKPVGKGHAAIIKGELPKNMAMRVKNNRTKEYLANLLMKTKKI